MSAWFLLLDTHKRQRETAQRRLVNGDAMIQMPAVERAKADIDADVMASITNVRRLVTESPQSTSQGIRILRTLRVSEYENLNQLQHRWLLVQARSWLERESVVLRDATWEWNPEQTGSGDEPDLRARIGGEIKISAEATTSTDPQGIIDSRMRDTFEKLSTMEGDLYCFVAADRMASRAKTKVTKNGWSIAVVQIQD